MALGFWERFGSSGRLGVVVVSAVIVGGVSRLSEDVEGFAAFHGAHRDRIAAAVSITCGSVALGEDATDEAMARAFVRWASVGAMANPAGWVYRVALNWSRSQRRRRRREDLTALVPELAGSGPSVDVDLSAAIADLDVDQRAVVVLRYLLGWSTAEAAEALEVAEGTVRSRLSRALDRLRVSLEVRG